MVGARQGWVEAPYAHCPAGGVECAFGGRGGARAQGMKQLAVQTVGPWITAGQQWDSDGAQHEPLQASVSADGQHRLVSVTAS